MWSAVTDTLSVLIFSPIAQNQNDGLLSFVSVVAQFLIFATFQGHSFVNRTTMPAIDRSTRRSSVLQLRNRKRYSPWLGAGAVVVVVLMISLAVSRNHEKNKTEQLPPPVLADDGTPLTTRSITTRSVVGSGSSRKGSVSGKARKTSNLVLDEPIMNLALEAAKLSNYTYETDPSTLHFLSTTFFTDEPDQALVRQHNGYCFAAFRGTTLTWNDWKQNFDPRKLEVCAEKRASFGCCTTRWGFFDAYNTTYRADLERAIRTCAEQTCQDPNECVVFTGHSQGGAVAAVAALVLADLNPYVFTFGQPVTIDAPCPMVPSDRWYRFINSKSTHTVGITYDPISFVPGLGADSFGHMMLLGEDSSSLAYIGQDAQDFFGPLDVLAEAHSMVGTAEHPGYLKRVQGLLKTKKAFPIKVDGYADGSLCSEHKECQSHKCERDVAFASFNRCIGTNCTSDLECPITGRCDTGMCVAKLGSCATCNEDSDCQSGKCLLYKCTNPATGLMDDRCNCRYDSDCTSGRCEGVAPPTCRAKLPGGSSCNARSDCLSDRCNWSFQCDFLPNTGGLRTTK